MTPDLLLELGPYLVAAAVAWGSSRATLSQQVKRTDELNRELDNLRASAVNAQTLTALLGPVNERLARIESHLMSQANR